MKPSSRPPRTDPFVSYGVALVLAYAALFAAGSWAELDPRILHTAAINLVGIGIFLWDKSVARFQLSVARVPENALLLPHLFGGILGCLLAMVWFRHKTQKRSFQLKFLGIGLLVYLPLLWFWFGR